MCYCYNCHIVLAYSHYHSNCSLDIAIFQLTKYDMFFSFYRTNYVKRFVLKRPFYKGKKDKGNEFKVRGEISIVILIVTMYIYYSVDIVC